MLLFFGREIITGMGAGDMDGVFGDYGRRLLRPDKAWARVGCRFMDMS